MRNSMEKEPSDFAGDPEFDLGDNLLEIDPAEERKLVRKVDWCLLPMMGFCYTLQYIDKTSLGQATLMGIRQDLNLTGSQYTWCSIIFYFGYLAWSWPTSYLIVRFPIAKYTAISTFIWGLVLLAHSLCTNYSGLLAVRFFLGVTESGVPPAFALITGMFYKRQEQPLRQGAWYMGSCIGAIIGGVLGYGVGTIEAQLATWRYLFIILGSVTAAFALLVLYFLPDSPGKAVFLNAREREIASLRIQAENTGAVSNSQFDWSQVWDALLDPQVWCLVLYTFCISLCNGGLTTFAAIIISGFGFSTLVSLLLQMPMGGTGVIFLVVGSVTATYLRSTRLVIMITNCCFALAGLLMIYLLPNTEKGGKIAGLCLIFAFTINTPLSLSLVSANVVGFTKRSTVSVMIFAAFSLGNIVGPQFYFPSEEPRYQSGIMSSISGTALGTMWLILMLVYYLWENRRRDRAYGPGGTPSTPEDPAASSSSIRTDRQMPGFRYVL